MSEHITRMQAYKAMYLFLRKIQIDTKSGDLASLLGDMSILPDGDIADNAVCSLWNDSIQNAIDNDPNIGLNLKKRI